MFLVIAKENLSNKNIVRKTNVASMPCGLNGHRGPRALKNVMEDSVREPGYVLGRRAIPVSRAGKSVCRVSRVIRMRVTPMCGRNGAHGRNAQLLIPISRCEGENVSVIDQEGVQVYENIFFSLRIKI